MVAVEMECIDRLPQQLSCNHTIFTFFFSAIDSHPPAQLHRLPTLDRLINNPNDLYTGPQDFEKLKYHCYNPKVAQSYHSKEINLY